jgi:hypothetical protein
MPFNPTPEQDFILQHDIARHARILAGPGTGKSATVVALIEKVLSTERPPRLKLLTFTRAAKAHSREDPVELAIRFEPAKLASNLVREPDVIGVETGQQPGREATLRFCKVGRPVRPSAPATIKNVPPSPEGAAVFCWRKRGFEPARRQLRPHSGRATKSTQSANNGGHLRRSTDQLSHLLLDKRTRMLNG